MLWTGPVNRPGPQEEPVNTPIYERALGRDFDRLQPELQEYFALAPGSGHYGVGEGVFDVVYSSNALDHTTAPRLCVEQMTARLRPGGLLLLEGLAREGSQAQWAGLHQHDLFPESGSLIHESRDGTRADLTSGLPLRCVSEQVTVFRVWGIHSCGYEIPEGGLAAGAIDWRDRDWYTVLWERT